MDEKLTQMLKYLRLSGLLTNWDQYLEIAQKGKYSHARLLEYVVAQEHKIKKENARKMRLARARIPETFVIETFPFNRQPKLNKKKIVNMYDRFDYMEKSQNLIFMGPTGTGKTGLATAFLTHAIDCGYNGRFVGFAELVEQLYQSVADHTEARVIKTFAATDCLVIDELGYVEVEPVQVGLFFTLMHKRHKKKTTLITTNLGFSQWSSFLKNDHLTAALIDRLTENSHVINMKNCVSLRPKLDPVA
jgi:DNA replication protein DnaC